MHLLRKAQIAHLKVEKACIKISNEYIDFTEIFLLKLAKKLPKHTKINNLAIGLVND